MRPSSCSAFGTESACLACKDKVAGPILEAYQMLEQAASGCEPDFGALVPSPTTVAVIEAARRGEVVACSVNRAPGVSMSSTGSGRPTNINPLDVAGYA